MARSINRSKVASMIYGVIKNGIRGIAYVPEEKPISKPKAKPKALYSHFSYAHTQNDYSAQRPKFSKNYGITNLKGPKNIWVPKDKIIYVVDILRSTIKMSIMVPGLWLLTTHDGKKAYVPRSGT